MLVKICTCTPDGKGNWPVGQREIHECSGYKIRMRPDDMVIVSLYNDKGEVILEMPPTDAGKVNIYIMNKEGKTIDSHSWNIPIPTKKDVNES